jgi:hypothetical protein
MANPMSRTSPKSRAMAIWFQMDTNERYSVRFGLFPAKKVRSAVAEGFNERDICAALAELARQGAGD